MKIHCLSRTWYTIFQNFIDKPKKKNAKVNKCITLYCDDHRTLIITEILIRLSSESQAYKWKLPVANKDREKNQPKMYTSSVFYQYLAVICSKFICKSYFFTLRLRSKIDLTSSEPDERQLWNGNILVLIKYFNINIVRYTAEQWCTDVWFTDILDYITAWFGWLNWDDFNWCCCRYIWKEEDFVSSDITTIGKIKLCEGQGKPSRNKNV